MKRTTMLLIFIQVMLQNGFAQDKTHTDLDNKVQSFLTSHQGQWYDMNVPVNDGKLLYDLIIEHNYTQALEIGTSTGHSAVWIAWALSKTGGKLITIEINKERHRQALENFEKAGVSDFIDARLADAHELVKELEGPFDFVFSDADKGWYTQYLQDVLPKLEPGGCFTAHNVTNLYSSSIKEFLQYAQNHLDLETTINKSSQAGVSISYKKKK